MGVLHELALSISCLPVAQSATQPPAPLHIQWTQLGMRCCCHFLWKVSVKYHYLWRVGHSREIISLFVQIPNVSQISLVHCRCYPIEKNIESSFDFELFHVLNLFTATLYLLLSVHFLPKEHPENSRSRTKYTNNRKSSRKRNFKSI